MELSVFSLNNLRVFTSLEWIFLIFLIGLGGFLFISPNLLNFILLSEITWISLYTLAILSGTYLDAALLISWGLFLFCIATAESVVGLSLLMFKFILYHNVRDEYLGAFNKGITQQKLGQGAYSHLND